MLPDRKPSPQNWLWLLLPSLDLATLLPASRGKMAAYILFSLSLKGLALYLSFTNRIWWKWHTTSSRTSLKEGLPSEMSYQVKKSTYPETVMLRGRPKLKPRETTWRKRPPARHQLSQQPGWSTRHVRNEAILNVPAPENAQGRGSVSSIQMAESWDIINWYCISH